MEKQEEQYRKLVQEIKPFLSLLSQASEAILQQEVSSYPIFILHQSQVALGVQLVDREESSSPWSVQVTTLEELVAKNVVNLDKLEAFRRVYKDPTAYFCLLMLTDDRASFLFLPHPGEGTAG